MLFRSPTIQDGSTQLWQRVGGDLFVLADRSGKLMALHTVAADFAPAQAQEMLRRSLQNGDLHDWWFGGGHLFQVFMQPIYFGEPANRAPLGVLVLGSEINSRVAEDVRRVASSQVAFRYGRTVVVSTLSPALKEALKEQTLPQPAAGSFLDLASLFGSREDCSTAFAGTQILLAKSYDGHESHAIHLNQERFRHSHSTRQCSLLCRTCTCDGA